MANIKFNYIGHFLFKTNNIPFKVVDNETHEIEPIRAGDLLPILEKNNAYGIDKFKNLLK
jgi:hypothetical protein